MNVIFTDGHLNGPNGVGGLFAHSGYTKISKNGREFSLNYEKARLTNSEAELLAIAHACLIAEKGDSIYTDSQFTVKMSYNGKTKIERFFLIIAFIKSAIKFKNLEIKWISRDKNLAT